MMKINNILKKYESEKVKRYTMCRFSVLVWEGGRGILVLGNKP